MRSRVAAALTVAAIGALIGAACGAGGQDGGRITASGVARDTSAAGSARMELTLTVPKSDVPLAAGTMRATGVADFRAGRGELVGDAPNGREETRWIGTVNYIRFDGSSSAGPTIPGFPDLAGKWLTFDTAAAGLPMVGPLGTAGRPDELLSMLRDASVSKRIVGHEAVREVATTHLRLTIDVAKMRKRFAAGSSVSLDTDPGTPARAPVDIWVDAQGRLRRMVGADTGSDPSTFRLELWDYGVAVHVDAPPAAEVVDLSKLGSAASTSGVASAFSAKVTGPWHLAAHNTPGQPQWQLWIAPGTDSTVCTSFENSTPEVPTSVSLPPELKDFPNHNGFPAFCQPAPRPGEVSFPWAQTADSETGPAVPGFAGPGVERVTFVPKHGPRDVLTPTGTDRVVVWTASPGTTLDHVVVTGSHGSVTCPADVTGGPPECPPTP